MNNFCCLCLTESNNITIIEDENDKICQQIETCLQLKVDFNDVKAAKICNDCLGQLLGAYDFYTKIHKAQLSGSVKVQLKLLPCDQETKTLSISEEKLTLNNNCLESLEESELDIKDELIENEKAEESFEEKCSIDGSEGYDEENKNANALACIKNWKTYPWYCYLCIYSAFNFTTLMEHMKMKHEISSSKKIQYQCVDCTKKLTNYTLFLNHVRLEHQPGLKLCCDICSKHFSDYTKLGEHRREHTEQSETLQPFIYHCNHCSRVFPSRQAINKHVLTHEQGLQCQICDKRFKRLKYLKRHMEMHAELKHKCDFCDKTFHRRFNKINHERTHTGDRPYKCDQCNKMFSFQSTLKSHQRTHTGELPYKCEQCSTKFRHYDSLKEHKRKHTMESPFSCSECDETFRYRKSLNRHMRLHAAKKPVKSEKKSKTTKIAKTKKSSTSASNKKKTNNNPRKTRTLKPN